MPRADRIRDLCLRARFCHGLRAYEYCLDWSLRVPTDPGPLVYEEVIRPGCGTGGRIAAGQILRLVDLKGQQVADFCSFMTRDPSDYCDMTYSTFKAQSWRLKDGDQLMSKRLEPMWTIVADDSRLHHSGGGFCSRELNSFLGLDQHGCRDTLEEQMASQGLNPALLHPSTCFNVFMNFPYGEDGSFDVEPPNTQAGDRIDLRAEADVTWVVSVCHMPGPCNGNRPSPMKLQLFNRL